MSAFSGPAVITNGLVLALDANSTESYPGSGTNWIDLSGNGNNATLVNAPTYGSGTFTFDGSTSYLSVPSTAYSGGTNPFTFSHWFNFSSMSGNWNYPSQKGLSLVNNSVTGGLEYVLQNTANATTTANYIYMGRYGGGTTGSLGISVTINANTWYNITSTSTGSAQVVYLNGVQIGTGNVSTSFVSGTNYIAASPNGGNWSSYMNGKMSAVSFYNRVLSAEEVTQNFNAIRGRYGI